LASLSQSLSSYFPKSAKSLVPIVRGAEGAGANAEVEATRARIAINLMYCRVKGENTGDV
jgi:hypothetical protein